MSVRIVEALLFCFFFGPLLRADQKPTKPEEKQKTSWSAKVNRRQNEANKIVGLEFLKLEVPVYLVQNQQRFRPYVELLIQYPSPDKDLFVGAKKLMKSKEGNFKLSFFLTSKVNQLLIESRPRSLVSTNSSEQSAALQIEKEVIYVLSPDAQEYKETDPLNILRVAGGISLMSYYQTGYDDYAAWMASLSLSYTSPIIKYNLGWETNFEGTILPIKTNKSNISPQVYHAELVAYYQFERKAETAQQYSLQGGFDYITMQSNGAPFGIKDLITPRLAFLARYIINEKEDWMLKFGICPGDMKLEQSGIDLDLSKGWLQSNSRRLEIGFKYQQYKINPDIQTNVRLVLSTVYLSYTL